jgi:hypothetical protein
MIITTKQQHEKALKQQYTTNISREPIKLARHYELCTPVHSYAIAHCFEEIEEGLSIDSSLFDEKVIVE